VNRMRGALASLNCDGRRGAVLAVVCGALLLPSVGGERARNLLRYERAGLAAGQWWRLLTAHLVHLDLRHALLNCLGLVLMWALFAPDYSAAQWLIVLLAAALAIDGGLWFGDSTIQWYVGSSGVLHGVMAAGALAAMRRGERAGWILGAILLVKLAYEHYAGALPFSGRDPVVVDAHLYGALGGSLAAAFLPPRRRSL
jgi:rhomboid family GlyGly-CTERM serine protease